MPDTKKTDLQSRAPLSRMYIIHQFLKDGGLPNRRKLSEVLEISQKTVQRDIDFMRDQLALPIEYDEKNFGYRYTEPVLEFPSMQITEGELLAMFIAHKAMVRFKGSPLESKVSSVLEKLGRTLPDKVSFSPSELEQGFSMRERGTSLRDEGIFSELTRAVLKRLEVEFEYCKLTSTRYEKRSVQPLHLACIEGLWYLFAHDPMRKAIRTFALTRMRDLEVSDMTFPPRHDFSLEKHLGDSFGVNGNSGRYQVRIWFDFLAAKLVREREWHPTQKIVELKDGEIELRMTLGSLTEVKRWILSFGLHAKALAPRKLVERIRQDATAISSYYLS